MVEYYAPGVYIEEIEMGGKPIEGVSTSVTAFIGRATSGPDMKPFQVTSWNDYETTFGGIVHNPKEIYLGYAVDAFFRNQGRQAYIVRVVSEGALKASVPIYNQVQEPKVNLLVIHAKEVGGGSDIQITTKESSYSGTVELFNGSIKLALDATGQIIGSGEDLDEFEVGDRVDIAGQEYALESIQGSLLTLNPAPSQPVAPGAEMRPANIPAGSKEIRVTNAAKLFSGSIIEIDSGGEKQYGIIENVIGKKLYLKDGLKNPITLAAEAKITVASQEFDLEVKRGSLVEKFEQLSTDPRHPHFVKKSVDSKLVTVEVFNPPIPAGEVTPKQLFLPELATKNLADGIPDDLSDKNVDYKKALALLEEIQGINLLAIPGQTELAVQKAMIDHCEKVRYRFAILDADKDTNIQKVKSQREALGSKRGYAALYYPWIEIDDRVNQYIPPSGAMAGIYARSDMQRGVHKAPANEGVAGAIALTTNVTKNQQEVLNPMGINALRFFKGQGIMVWGARTIAGDPLWKYINVRRLFLWLEESIEVNTQWVVFEPNNERLWDRVKATITEFLTRVWRDGALMGLKAEEAFFVKCDRTTMTQSDIDNGRLIVTIGVSPTKPAEFVIFQIAQWTGGAKGASA